MTRILWRNGRGRDHKFVLENVTPFRDVGEGEGEFIHGRSFVTSRNDVVTSTMQSSSSFAVANQS